MERSHEIFMKEALKEAKKGLGRTHPNPAVGAVIVRDGKILSRGYHKRAGKEHAEVSAINKIKGDIRAEDILYVTLEPCNHYGRTPPCTQAIMKSGIKNVVIGMLDPNPHVRGGGAEFLQNNGINVTVGILEKECRRLNEAYIKFVQTGLPFVIAKSALTLDGFTATSTGDSKWITNDKSRAFVHRLREQVDGIMVGIGTVMKDNPLLTARAGRRSKKNPIRIIVDTTFKIPHNSKVLEDESAKTIIAIKRGVLKKKRSQLLKKHVSIIECPTKKGRIDLLWLMKELGTRQMVNILFEGGATLMGSMINERLIDKFYIFKAPKLLGASDGIPFAIGSGPRTIKDALKLKDLGFKRFGNDILIYGYPEYNLL